MVVPKKNGKLRIYVDLRKLNAAPKKDPYPLPFTNEVLNTIAGHDAYSFLDGYSKYHQIFIALKDTYKTTFVIDWGAFTWVVMFFRVKNGPPTYQRVVSRVFKDYLRKFMNYFLDDCTVHSDMDTYMYKLKLCFQKCKEFGINLNPNKCACMVFLGMILGFIISKEGKLPDPKKIQAIVQMHVPTNP